jgi:hypothetical protein
MVADGRRCQSTIASTAAAVATTPTTSARRRERIPSDGVATQSERVFFSLCAPAAGVTIFTRSSRVFASSLLVVPGLCNVRSEDGDLSAVTGLSDVERKMPEIRDTDGCERGANGASASASSATVW